MIDPWQEAQTHLKQVVKTAGLKTGLFNLIGQHDRIITAKLVIKTDDGRLRSFTAYRSQHNNALGPYKGGIRFHPQVTESEVKALSLWMTLKTSLVGIPYGGGKGGVVVDPKQLSTRELERLSREYVRRFFFAIGPDVDIPAPDVNTNAQIMAWMVDEYAKLAGSSRPAAFTGKPVSLGGSLGRQQATGRGGVVILKEMAKAYNLKPKTTALAVQGFGNVGYWFALLASKAGYKVVAVSDSQATLYNSEGLDIEKVKQAKQAKGSVAFGPGQKLPTEAVLTVKADVLVPAALENAINKTNVDSLTARYIIEMANGPITNQAEKILLDKQVVIIPDILANAGGVTVSYFEWVQNRTGYYWEVEEVFAKLDKIMVKAFSQVHNLASSQKLNHRQAAYVVSLNRIARAEQARFYS